ncbi:hypothetical protein [Natronoglomus mannanivorans]|uniref:Uncharacterized protein n=1 Tax=Natronoglomus mannanivorans TaxID=2979990 RepID=A0AAP3E4M3_9EURY|nr:hypothetical protein [Halobacteria archaeon AArc-xg1-1]
MQIERGAVYEHDEYGEVVVTNILRRYSTYDVDLEEGEIEETSIAFSAEWDSHGAIPATEKVDDADSFTNRVGDKIRTLTFVSPSS